MNKAELIDTLATKLNMQKKQVEVMLDSLLTTIIATLKEGKEVTLTGFGTFMAKERSARGGVNPLNPKERIQIPAVTIPKFKAGKTLKDALKS
jgi:DNA-binding protein HU-beta